MKQCKRLDNKTAVVIGSTSGIGEVIAKTYAREGALTIVSGPSIERELGMQVVEEILAEGGTASFVAVDVRDEAAVISMYEQILSEHGRIDIVNFNAGVQDLVVPFCEQTLEDWDRMVNVNARGCFLSMKHIIPHMIERKQGVIINTASVSASKCVFPHTLSMYAMTKAQVVSLTKSAAYEYSKYNIRINAISPGYVLTKKLGLGSLPQEAQQAMLSNVPMGRLATPEDVAKVSLFLASDDSEYLTGQELHIDGGMTVI
ncbi:MAG: SDR family NAD(P)-dependent oxidoreductase [Saccharofermentanales bacterium]|jgi:NAD(P)-dependent dehydrogenase (short-subunit alcohol dehydrogenase family)|nr:glucose 1-dehydrogenase [Clostridiaceae bacterium]